MVWVWVWVTEVRCRPYNWLPSHERRWVSTSPRWKRKSFTLFLVVGVYIEPMTRASIKVCQAVVIFTSRLLFTIGENSSAVKLHNLSVSKQLRISTLLLLLRVRVPRDFTPSSRSYHLKLVGESLEVWIVVVVERDTPFDRCCTTSPVTSLMQIPNSSQDLNICNMHELQCSRVPDCTSVCL